MFKSRLFFIIAVLVLCAGGGYALNTAQDEISAVSAMSVLLPKSAGKIAVFERRNGLGSSQMFWVSRKYSGVSFCDEETADALFYGFDAGYEKKVAEGWYLGLYADYNSGNTEIGGRSGAKISNEFYSASLYGLWIGQNGAFAQVSAANFFTNSGFKVLNSDINYSLERNIAAFCGEFGKEFDFNVFIFEPKISLSYFNADAKEIEDINFGALSSFDARVSFLISFAVAGLSPYIGAGFGCSFLGESDIVYNDKTFVSDISGALFEAVLGAEAFLSDSLSAVAGFNYESALYGSSYGILLSIKYAFGQKPQKPENISSSRSEDRRTHIDYAGFKPIVPQGNPKPEDLYDAEFAEFIPVEEQFLNVQPEEKFKKEEDFDVENLNAGESSESKRGSAAAPKKNKPEGSITVEPAKIIPQETVEEILIAEQEEIKSKSEALEDNVRKEEPARTASVSAPEQNDNAAPKPQKRDYGNYEEGTGKKLTLGSSYFKPGQSEIGKSGKEYLNQIAIMLREVDIKRIIITGHADAEGDGQEFMTEAIAENRAASAAAILVSNGIAESKIIFRGEGSSRPLKKKKGQQDKPDRRVEIEIFE